MDDGNIVRPVLLSSLAEMMISQKRHEWCQDPCELTLTIKYEATFCWVEVAPNEVKRLLSNLLNNAYDALLVKKQGSIHIMISVFNNTLYMQIHDNGIGIHPDKISDVLNGVSTKHTGKGLGISSAKHSDYWGMKINAISKLILIDYAFNSLKFNRVGFCVDSINQRSCSALKKLGIKQEGVLRNHLILSNGRIRHSVVFSVIYEEWPEIRKIITKNAEILCK